MRNSTLTQNSKTLKIFGQGYSTTGNYSNCTWGTYYTGLNAFTINYGDVEYNGGAGSNDTTINLDFGDFPRSWATLPDIGNGSEFTRTPYPTKTYLPGLSYIPDTDWHLYEYFMKFSDTIPDGEFAMWLDGKLLMNLTNLWNASSGQQLRNFISLGDFGQYWTAAWNQDFKDLNISYDRPVGRGLQVTLADVLLAQKYLLNQTNLTTQQLNQLDVYPVGGDGLITFGDLLALQQKVLHLDTH
jgi:hypothetical protein